MTASSPGPQSCNFKRGAVLWRVIDHLDLVIVANGTDPPTFLHCVADLWMPFEFEAASLDAPRAISIRPVKATALPKLIAHCRLNIDLRDIAVLA